MRGKEKGCTLEREESEEEKESVRGRESMRKDGRVATLKQLNSAGLTGDQ